MTPPIDAALVAKLFADSRGHRWSLAPDAFAAAVAASVAHAFAGRDRDDAEIARYATTLHVEDLALATACAAGSESAWEHFIAEFRPQLQRSADAIDPTGNARELADSLFADLYGLANREGVRKSLFRYFHGRSKLGTWLRAVLSQRHIDRLRAGRKLESLPEDTDTLASPVQTGPSDPARKRFETAMTSALTAAIGALDPRDRLRLSCYYVQDMTLAAIGRMLKEHEATVSRNLTRTRAAVRDAVAVRLRADHGMDDEAIAECFRSVSADAGAMDLATLVGGGLERKNVAADRSRE